MDRKSPIPRSINTLSNTGDNLLKNQSLLYHCNETYCSIVCPEPMGACFGDAIQRFDNLEDDVRWKFSNHIFRRSCIDDSSKFRSRLNVCLCNVSQVQSDPTLEEYGAIATTMRWLTRWIVGD